MTIDDFICRFGQSETRERPDGWRIHRGFTMADAFELARSIPPRFHFREDWADGPYRHVWTSETERAIITFCEGDVSIERFETGEQYRAGLEKCADFYAAH